MASPKHIFWNVVRGENDLTELLRNFLEYPLFRKPSAEGYSNGHWKNCQLPKKYSLSTASIIIASRICAFLLSRLLYWWR